MTNEISVPPVKRPRLYFIDIARSFAILLMLEGHFIDHTLGEQFRSPDPHFVNPDFLVYDIWHIIRGYTSPMFLTMTGMVFVYLLYGSNEKPFRENKRITKGFKRVLELLFWGYLLNPRSFHILQCIAFGILGLLLVYGLYKLIKIIPLWVYYFILSALIFSCYAPLSEIKLDGEKIPWPYGWPDFIQNMIHAPGGRSLFPLAPSLGYTFFGAGVGVVLHSAWINKTKWNIPLFLLSIGLSFTFFPTEILTFTDTLGGYFGLDFEYLVLSNWLFETMGVVFIVLSLLSTFERLVTIKENLFIRIGQNTLSIFIIHMMLLYGAVIKIGIGTFFSRSHNALNPYEAGIGAGLFIALFVVMIYYIVPLSTWFDRMLDIIIPIRKRINK